MKNRTMIAHDKNGEEMIVAVRDALPVDSPCARYTGFKQETLLLKKGTIRLKGYMPLPCRHHSRARCTGNTKGRRNNLYGYFPPKRRHPSSGDYGYEPLWKRNRLSMAGRYAESCRNSHGSHIGLTKV